MLEPSSHFFTSARLRLHYVRWGSQDLEPLLLIHGGLDHCRTWDWFAHGLKDRYQIIALDLRGHGDSDWATGNAYSMIDYTYDLIELIEHLNISDFSIVGHSLGGAIAFKYTGLFPEKVKQLVTIESLGSSPQKLAVNAKQTADQHAFSWIRKMQRLQKRTSRNKGLANLEVAIDRMRQVHSNLSAEQARHLTIHGSRKNEAGEFQWKADPYVRAYQPFDMSTEATHQLWARVTCPVLLVCGEDSWASNPAIDGRDQYFNQAEVVCIPGAGHSVHHDQLELFLDTVENFLAD